jgi:hypothetical protein
VTIQWRYENRVGLGVLYVTGFLGAVAVDRFRGAVGWALARGTGTLIVDVTAYGIDTAGLAQIADAARRLAVHGRPVELCGALPEADLAELRPVVAHVYPDLDAALATHASAETEPDGRGERESGHADDWRGRGPRA